MAEIVARGVRHHVQRLGRCIGAGDGEVQPTVVFLHGLVMDNLSSWYFTAATRVAKVAPVFLYDLRGHGKSARPPTGYGLESLVEDLAALLDAARLDGVRLVGNSFGGLLALAFALAHPERVRELFLVDALLPEPGWGTRMAESLSKTGEERDRLIGERFQSWLGRHSARKRSRLADTAAALVERTSLLDDLRRSEGYADEAYARLSMPIEALYGAESDVRAQGERLARATEACRLSLLPGATHSILWERTDEVCRRLIAWARGGAPGDLALEEGTPP